MNYEKFMHRAISNANLYKFTAKPNPVVGAILIKGENVMLGYWNLKEETAKVIKDGWLHTGDIGKFDENNYLKIKIEKL